MAYPITNTAGTTIATIADGTVNSSATSLTLIGKNYAGYGNFLNENFVELLENFSYGAPPSNPLTGQLWWDSANTLLKICVSGSSNEWKPISSLTAASVAPSTPAPTVGDQYWNTVSEQLSVWSGPTNQWVTIGPAFSAVGGTSGAVAETIKDSNNNNQTVVKLYTAGTVIGIVSGNATPFTPQTTISGFGTINPGFNLISSNTLTGSQFTGNASNALLLNGIGSNQFLRSDTAATTNYQLGVGLLQVGSDLLVSPTASSEISFSSNSASKKDISFYVNSNSLRAVNINGSNAAIILSNTVSVLGTLNAGSTLNVTGNAVIQGITTHSNSLLPNVANTVNIGSTGTPFANVYSNNLNGNVNATGYIQNPVYSTTTARDAAITSPKAGMTVFVTSGANASPTFYGYTGSQWVSLN